MEFQRIEKVFNLMKPVLPTSSISMFEEFISDYKQLLELSSYNNQIIDNLRISKAQLYEQIEEKNFAIEKSLSETKEMKNEIDVLKDAEYDRQKEIAERDKCIELLRKEVIDLTKEHDKVLGQLNTAKKHNKKLKGDNAFIRTLHNRAIREIEHSISVIEHEALVKAMTEEKEEYIKAMETKEAELKAAQHEINDLTFEVERLREKAQENYSSGFQKGRYEYKRKRKY